MRTIAEIKKDLEQVKNEIKDLFKRQMKGENTEQLRYPKYRKETQLKDELIASENYFIEVGEGITLCMYTDCEAYTVIKRTEKTIVIQRDKATLSKDFKPEIIAGGFAGHCVNNDDQTYNYECDPKGKVIRLYWSNKRNRWMPPKGYSYAFKGRHEFYDYNF